VTISPSESTLNDKTKKLSSDLTRFETIPLIESKRNSNAVVMSNKKKFSLRNRNIADTSQTNKSFNFS